MRTVSPFRRPSGQPPYVFGHRGVRGRAPENTMKAFDLAVAEGADGIELDVRLCRTGEVVVCHDPTLARFAGGKDARAVVDLSLAELATVDVGEGEKVPSLSEVLYFAEGRSLKVNIELKRDVPDRRAAVRATAALLEARGTGLANIIVSSFDPWMLAHFGWLLPRVSRGFLFEEGARFLRSGWPALPLGAQAVHPPRAVVDAARCRAWRRQGKLINVWTVNDADSAKALAALGVDAIITDVPGQIADAVR